MGGPFVLALEPVAPRRLALAPATGPLAAAAAAAAVAAAAAREATRPPSRALRRAASSRRQGPSPSGVRVASALAGLAAGLGGRRPRGAAHAHGPHEPARPAGGHAGDPLGGPRGLGPRSAPAWTTAARAVFAGLRGSRLPGKPEPVLGRGTSRRREPGAALGRAAAARADRALDAGLHEDLQHGPGEAARQARAAAPGAPLGQGEGPSSAAGLVLGALGEAGDPTSPDGPGGPRRRGRRRWGARRLRRPRRRPRKATPLGAIAMSAGSCASSARSMLTRRRRLPPGPARRRVTGACLRLRTSRRSRPRSASSTPAGRSLRRARRRPAPTRSRRGSRGGRARPGGWGMQTGPLAVWPWNALRAKGPPVARLDARHAHGVPKVMLSKTDRRGRPGPRPDHPDRPVSRRSGSRAMAPASPGRCCARATPWSAPGSGSRTRCAACPRRSARCQAKRVGGFARRAEEIVREDLSITPELRPAFEALVAARRASLERLRTLDAQLRAAPPPPPPTSRSTAAIGKPSWTLPGRTNHGGDTPLPRVWQIGRMALVAIAYSRAEDAAGRAAPLSAATMGDDDEATEASDHPIDITARPGTQQGHAPEPCRPR